MDEYNRIMASDMSEAEKIKAGFEWITDIHVADAEREIELLRALNDREALVKAQIRLALSRHVRGILEQCYRDATGRRRTTS